MDGLTAATLRAALVAAHQTLEATLGEVSDEVANAPVPGRANPIGASYAHVALAEDAMVNGLLRGHPPLWATTWAGKTGTDQAMPMPGLVEGDLGAWYHTVRVDLAACRAYAQVVYAQTGDFLAEADDAALSRGIDMSFVGLGTIPVAEVLSIFVIGHANNLCGEISAVKGVNGLRGYPF